VRGTSETYPSGRVVTTGYDGANREKSVAGQYAAIATSYATASYAPQGAPSSLTDGNNLVRNYTYNNRLQPNGLWDAVNRVTGPAGRDANNNLLWAQNSQYDAYGDAYGNSWMPSWRELNGRLYAERECHEARSAQ
jgi:hypothetical protein